jgi:serine protease inhibitor
MTEPKKLKISEVIQKTVIEVNEKDTEVAAVTAIGMVLLGSSPQKVKSSMIFHVDHPFLFLKWD